MKSSMRKVFLVVISLFIFAYVGYQGYQFFYSPYGTEIVLEDTLQKSVSLQGIVIRDEHTLNEEATGVIQYLYENGDKVSAGAEVARRFDTEEDIVTNNKILLLQDQIDLLNKSQNAGYNTDATLDTVIAQLDSVYAEFMMALQTNTISGVSGYKNDMLLYLNRRQIVTEQISDFNELIAELEQEKASLTESLGGTEEPIYSSDTGYFTNQVDGMESLYSTDMVPGMTASKLDEILKQEQADSSSNSIGKVITGNEWKYVSFISVDDIQSMKEAGSLIEGTLLHIRFGSLGNSSVRFMIESVHDLEYEGKQMVVFSSDIMNSDVTTLRKEDGEIVLQNISGLKVNKDALYVEKDDDGVEQKGVYVIYGKKMMFKRVDVVAEENDFFISKVYENDSDYLQVYDEVIIRGKDLYDNKPV